MLNVALLKTRFHNLSMALALQPRNLILGILAVVLLFVGVLWVTARVTEASALSQLLNHGNRDLRLYIANIRRELDRYEYLPKLLANDSRVKALVAAPSTVDQRHALDRYLAFVAKTSGAADVYLMNQSGLTLASSNWNKQDSFVGDNYSFRPYYQQAIQGKLGHYYALGLSSGQRGYYFAYPVRDDQGHIRGALAVKVTLAALEHEQGNAHYQFLVTDPHGVIFLSTRPAWRYHPMLPLAPEERHAIETGRRYLQHPLTPLPGASVQPFNGEASLYSVREQGKTVTYLRRGMTMPDASWRVYILLNVAQVHQEVVRALVLAALILGALVLVVLILRQRRARLDERMRYEHAAMEAAATSEARVRAIIDNTQAGLVTLDREGRIASFNPTAEALFGRDARMVNNMRLTDLLAQNSREAFNQRLQPDADNDGAPPLELSGQRRDGSLFPLEVSVNAMPASNGMRFIVTLHDITERKEQEAALQAAYDHLEQRVVERTSDLMDSNRRLVREIEEHRRTGKELSQARDELIQAAKLAAIGQLSAGINHELNQPLTAIRFYAGNARTFLDKSRTEEVRENLGHIDGLADRMARIITQLKLFARKSSGAPVPVSMNAVIEGALTLLAPRLNREEVAVIRHIPDQDIYCLGDMVRLEQVLVNLLNNAMQAMEEQDSPQLEISVRLREGRVEAAVRDNGPGIARADLSQIFDPFFTTKEVGEGLGLGLSISLRIVEELGGTMRAENHPDGGAVFTVSLKEAPAQENNADHG